MGFLSKLHNCYQSTAHWFTDFTYIDQNGHTSRKSSNNLMKMLFGGAVATSIFGFYGFAQKETYEEPETLGGTIVITTLGLGGTAVIIAMTIKNYLEINPIITSRNQILNEYKETEKFISEFKSKKILETIKTKLEDEKKLEKKEEVPPEVCERTIIITNNQKQQCSITMLPQEIITSIFQFLAFADLLKVSLTCKKWFILSSIDTLWAPFIIQKIANQKIANPKIYEGRNGYISYRLEKDLMKNRNNFNNLNAKLLTQV